MPDKNRMQMVVTPVVPYDLFQITAPINRQNRDQNSPCHTLARDNAAHAAVVTATPAYDPCPTLTSRMQGSTGWAPYNEDAHLVAHVGSVPRMSVRRLTPTECERLQGFPDGWTQVAWKGKAASECPDGPRYKALGNSMAVNCMRWIGARIQAVEEA
jgi:DNA (cytosine-5)-methyltransferase 1